MKAIVTGDAEYVARSFDNLPPGAHVAVRTSPTQLPDSGIALRLAGFEIRDTIAHIVGDRIVWWILARKPLDGTVAANVLAHGVGGLNIDACRVGTDGGTRKGTFPKGKSEGIYGDGINGACEIQGIGAGRFPANVLLDERAAAEMDRQSVGTRAEKSSKSGSRGATLRGATWKNWGGPGEELMKYADSGGASRFFPLLDEDDAENWIRRLIDPDQSQ